MSVPVDRRKKYKRIKSRSEPVRKTKGLFRGERTKVQLSLASLITTDENQAFFPGRFKRLRFGKLTFLLTLHSIFIYFQAKLP
jgi:hypothetical protein